MPGPGPRMSAEAHRSVFDCVLANLFLLYVFDKFMEVVFKLFVL